MTLPGLTGVVAGVGAASGVTVSGTLTAGDDGIVFYQGFSIDSNTIGGSAFGSLSVGLDPNGYTIDAMLDDGGTFTYVVQGNRTATPPFSSIEVNGVVFNRLDSAVPGGSYDGGFVSTTWIWAGSASISSGNPYAYEITA